MRALSLAITKYISVILYVCVNAKYMYKYIHLDQINLQVIGA